MILSIILPACFGVTSLTTVCWVAGRPPWEGAEKVPIEEILKLWAPTLDKPLISSMTFKGKGWYEFMPSDAPGTLFVGQCVFLRPEDDESPPFILLVTELYPPEHPSKKTGCGYYFWRAEDVRVLSGVTDFQGSDEESELYVTKQKAEFEVDEILDLMEVQPYFVGEELEGLYYKVSKPYLSASVTEAAPEPFDLSSSQATRMPFAILREECGPSGLLSCSSKIILPTCSLQGRLHWGSCLSEIRRRSKRDVSTC